MVLVFYLVRTGGEGEGRLLYLFISPFVFVCSERENAIESGDLSVYSFLLFLFVWDSELENETNFQMKHQ